MQRSTNPLQLPTVRGDTETPHQASLRDLAMDILRMARQYWRPTALLVAAFALLGGLIYMATPPTYEASSEILMLNKRLAAPGSPETARSGYVRYESPQPEDLQTEIRILESRDLIEAAAAKFTQSDAERPLFRDNPYSDTSGESAALGAYDDLEDRLSFDVAPGSHVIVAEFRDKDPDMAARFLNLLLEEYLSRRADILSNDGALSSLRENRDFYRTRLEAIENEMTALQRQSRVGDLETEKAIALQQIEQELVAVAALQDRILDVSQLLDYLQKALPTFKEGRIDAPPSTPARFADSELKDAQARLFAALTDLQTKLATFTPGSEAVRAARAVYGRQRSSYIQLAERKQEELQEEMTALVATVNEKQRRIAELSTRNAALEDHLARRQTIAIERQAAEEAYLSASARVNAVEATQSSDTGGFSNVRILQPAVAPESPDSPVLAWNLLLGVLTGASFAAGNIFLREWNSDVLNSERDIISQLKLPVLESLIVNDRD